MNGQFYTKTALSSGKKPSVTIEWSPESVWALWRRQNFLFLTGIEDTVYRLSSPWPRHCTEYAVPAHVHLIQRCYTQLTCRSVSTLGHSTCHMGRKVHYIPIPPLTGFLRCWSQKGLDSSPVFSRESPRTEQYLLDVLAVGYMGRLTAANHLRVESES